MAETGRIRIGNQTAFSASNVTEPFRYAVVNGFDAFEWFPDKKESGAGWTEHDIGKKTRALIRKIAFDRDIALSIHAPWQAIPLEQKGREVLYRHVEFAKDMGASLFNVHLYTEDGIDSYVEAISPLLRLLTQNRIKLAIENTPITGPEAFNELFERLRYLGSKDAAYAGMCLDPGHANLYPATHNDYLKFTDFLDPQVPIIHLHMHENYGDYDSHLPLFTGAAGKDPEGISGLIDRLNKRCFSGTVILEQWPQPPSLLNESRNRLIEMFTNS